MTLIDRKDASWGLPDWKEQAPVGDKEILASTQVLLITGVTLEAGAGLLDAGTILGRITASGKFKQYLNTNSDGSEIPRGILRHAVDLRTASDGDKAGEMFYGGVFYSDMIVEPTNGSIADAVTSGGIFTGAKNDTTANRLVIL